jgi:hypothetical protein
MRRLGNFSVSRIFDLSGMIRGLACEEQVVENSGRKSRHFDER